MSHLIKIYAVCKFSYFHLWFLKSETGFSHPNVTLVHSNTGPDLQRVVGKVGLS